MSDWREAEIERLAEAVEHAYVCRTCGADCFDGSPPSDCAGRCSLDTPTAKSRVRALLKALRGPWKGRIWRSQDDDFLHPVFDAPSAAGVRGGEYDMAAHEAHGALIAIVDALLDEKP